ncbi:hypothetical protein MtrunA17_Chr4g0041211 [Medicago truncatula]|uniref:Transmembrane protein n=1 Tax=Medicago truncatula TaxID=3880 RepID=A0A396IAP9_MEDTR|nr:hypothetical protein MtrunA17_Chr4g0041211 [Medicago truncatula]
MMILTKMKLQTLGWFLCLARIDILRLSNNFLSLHPILTVSYVYEGFEFYSEPIMLFPFLNL